MADFEIRRGENAVLPVNLRTADGAPISVGLLLSLTVSIYYSIAGRKYTLAVYTPADPEITFSAPDQVALEISTFVSAACFAFALGVDVEITLADNSFPAESNVRTALAVNADAVGVAA